MSEVVRVEWPDGAPVIAIDATTALTMMRNQYAYNITDQLMEEYNAAVDAHLASLQGLADLMTKPAAATEPVVEPVIPEPVQAPAPIVEPAVVEPVIPDTPAAPVPPAVPDAPVEPVVPAIPDAPVVAEIPEPEGKGKKGK